MPFKKKKNRNRVSEDDRRTKMHGAGHGESSEKRGGVKSRRAGSRKD